MQMIYTIAELQKMDTEELTKLTCFGDNLEYLYNNISHFEYPTTVIISNQKVSCGTIEILESIKIGKIRYDVMSATLAGISYDNTSRDNLREEIKETVRNEIHDLKATISNVASNAVKTFEESNSEMLTSAKDLNNTLYDMKSAFRAKLDSVDTEEFGPKMYKIDRIVKAFEALLVDK